MKKSDMQKDMKKNIIYQVSNLGHKKQCYLNVSEELTILCDKTCSNCLKYTQFENDFDEWIMKYRI